jgi:uncharacterized damage-inducible protein DinB
MRRLLTAIALSLAIATPASAQTSFMGDMHSDVNEVQKKVLDLARAIPEAAYGWRPGAGVRSIGEVLQHMAADNYLIPVAMGKPAPASTGITSDYNTAAAYEKRSVTKAQAIAELEASFTHLHQGMGLTTDANLAEKIDMFGQKWTRQRAMVLTVTHLHEHLGQLIAYARSNNVAPPWSR